MKRRTIHWAVTWIWYPMEDVSTLGYVWMYRSVHPWRKNTTTFPMLKTNKSYQQTTLQTTNKLKNLPDMNKRKNLHLKLQKKQRPYNKRGEINRTIQPTTWKLTTVATNPSQKNPEPHRKHQNKYNPYREIHCSIEIEYKRSRIEQKSQMGFYRFCRKPHQVAAFLQQRTQRSPEPAAADLFHPQQQQSSDLFASWGDLKSEENPICWCWGLIFGGNLEFWLNQDDENSSWAADGRWELCFPSSLSLSVVDEEEKPPSFTV